MELIKERWSGKSGVQIAIVLGAVLSFLIGYAWLNASPASRGSDTSPITRKAKDMGGITNSTAAKAAMMDKAEQRKMHEENVKGWEKVDSIAKAAQMVPFELRGPNSSLTGESNAVYIDDHGGLLPASVHAYFGDDPMNGISYTAEISTEKFDPALTVAEMVAAKERGELKTNNVPYVVDVNGYAGMAWEPGFNLINGEEHAKGGVVRWQDKEGVIYQLGDTNREGGTPVKELLKIARSMGK